MREPAGKRDGKKEAKFTSNRIHPLVFTANKRGAPVAILSRNAPPSSSVSATTAFINAMATGAERPKESTSQVSLLQTSLAMGCSL